MIYVVAKTFEDFQKWQVDTQTHRPSSCFDALCKITTYINGPIALQGICEPTTIILLDGCQKHPKWVEIKKGIQTLSPRFRILKEIKEI